MANDDVWQFPCQLNLKIVGDQRDGFNDDVISAIQQHVPGDYAVRETPSSGGRYVSLTVPIYFVNKEQLQQVYQALRQVAGVKMVL